jgi:predicted secreted hydrolase
MNLSVRNPVAESIVQTVQPAPRVADLNGKHVGLYWNVKAGGDLALERTEVLLRERFPDTKFSYYRGTVGMVMRHVSAAEADRIAKEVDVIVGTSSD